MNFWKKLSLNKPVRLQITGYVDGVFQEETLEIHSKEAAKILPAMMQCLVDRFIPEVEVLNHPYNGWQITSLVFEPTDAEVRTPGDNEWDELQRIARANGSDFSEREIDPLTGHFVD